MSEDGSSLIDDPDWTPLRDPLVEVCGGSNSAALVLEQMLWWQHTVRMDEDRGEWFSKSARNLSDDLGPKAGKSACQTALKKLEDLGVLDSRQPDDPQSPKEWRVDDSALRSRTIEAGYDFDAIDWPYDTLGPPVRDADTPPVRDADTPVRKTDRSKYTNKEYNKTSSSGGARDAPSPVDEPAPTPEEQQPQNQQKSPRPEWGELDDIQDGAEFFRQLARHFGNEVSIRNANSYWKDIITEATKVDASVDDERLRFWVKRKYRALDEGGYTAAFIHRTIVEDTSEAVAQAVDDTESEEVDTITEDNGYTDQLDYTI